MEYTKSKIKRNLFLMYLSNFAFGITLGICDTKTIMQELFNIIGGESLMFFMNMFFQIAMLVTLIFLFIKIERKNIKGILLSLEFMIFTNFLILGILIVTQKITVASLVIIFAITLIINRIEALIYQEFLMKIAPRGIFKMVYGYLSSISSISIVVGMIISHYVLKWEYPYNYFWLFVIVFIFGIIAISLRTFILEPKIQITKEDNDFSPKEAIKTLVSLPILKFFLAKLFFNMGDILVVLIGFITIKKGYTAADMALMLVGFHVVAAISCVLVGKIKIKSTKLMLISNIVTFISMIVILYFNIYLAFIVAAVRFAFVNISYYGFINERGVEKRKIYLIALYIVNAIAAIQMYVYIHFIDNLSKGIIALILGIMLCISSIFTYLIDENRNRIFTKKYLSNE